MSRMTKLRVLVLPVLSFGLMGCSTPGRHLDLSVVDQIKKGSATRQEVEQRLGKPSNVLTGVNSNTVAVYEYGRIEPNAGSQPGGVLPTSIGEVHWRTVSILYDERGIVQKTLFYESVTPYERNQRSVSAGHVVTEEELSRIKAGQTTTTDLRKMFGPPMSKTMTVDGDVMLVWHYGRAAGKFSPSLKRQALMVRVNEAEVVVDYVVGGDGGQPPAGN